MGGLTESPTLPWLRASDVHSTYLYFRLCVYSLSHEPMWFYTCGSRCVIIHECTEKFSTVWVASKKHKVSVEVLQVNSVALWEGQNVFTLWVKWGRFIARLNHVTYGLPDL